MSLPLNDSFTSSSLLTHNCWPRISTTWQKQRVQTRRVPWALSVAASSVSGKHTPGHRTLDYNSNRALEGHSPYIQYVITRQQCRGSRQRHRHGTFNGVETTPLEDTMSDKTIRQRCNISHRRKEEGEPVGDGACPADLLSGFTQPRQGLGAPCRPVAKLLFHLRSNLVAHTYGVVATSIGECHPLLDTPGLGQSWLEGESYSEKYLTRRRVFVFAHYSSGVGSLQFFRRSIVFFGPQSFEAQLSNLVTSPVPRKEERERGWAITLTLKYARPRRHAVQMHQLTPKMVLIRHC